MPEIQASPVAAEQPAARCLRRQRGEPDAASRVVRQTVRMPLAYIGGVKSLDNVAQLMGEGFDAVALARALIHDPALVAGWRAGTLQRSACDSCNGCVARIYDPAGVSCVHGPGNDPALTRMVALQ
ncbi:hypothetical protein LIN44_21090 [Cupriavidus sp. MP-37]|nr:hypothetical protein [Cupriavidus sp. MP-37]UDM53794.1 hypothetical protein LIN44_21090 [Cupriavidus sp. MP-37]